MASYQPTVLPAAKQPLEQIFGSLNSGLGKVASVYEAALIKNKFKDAKATKTQDYSKLIPEVIAGMKSPSALPNYADMSQAVEGTNPGMSDMLDAGIPVTDAAGAPFDQNSNDSIIRDALTKQYAPGYNQDQVTRSVMHLPVNVPGDKSGGKLPGDFTTDFKSAYDDAGGDEDKFVKNLQGMSVKYGDNPAAVNQIAKLIALNKKTKKSSGAGVLEE